MLIKTANRQLLDLLPPFLSTRVPLVPSIRTS